VYPSHLLNDVHTRPVFELDKSEGRWGRSYQDAEHHFSFGEGFDRRWAFLRVP